jgi:pyrimidine operon attenuation protein/uracil phosphoribosyltransferase
MLDSEPLVSKMTGGFIMPIKVVMTAEEMRRSLARMAHEIVERNKSIDNIILVGMRTRGVPLCGENPS